jgi:hypothetical protein
MCYKKQRVIELGGGWWAKKRMKAGVEAGVRRGA